MRRQYPTTLAERQAIAEAICRAGERAARRAEAACDVLLALVVGIAGALALVHWWAA